MTGRLEDSGYENNHRQDHQKSAKDKEGLGIAFNMTERILVAHG